MSRTKTSIMWIIILSTCIIFDAFGLVYGNGPTWLGIFAIVLCSIALVLQVHTVIRENDKNPPIL